MGNNTHYLRDNVEHGAETSTIVVGEEVPHCHRQWGGTGLSPGQEVPTLLSIVTHMHPCKGEDSQVKQTCFKFT